MGILQDLRANGWELDDIDEIETAARRLRNGEYARDLNREWNANELAWTLPHAIPLDDFTKIHDRDPEFTIAGLLPSGGTALLYGPEKSGKSHMTANAIRALADGTPFLNRFETKQRKVTLIDLELNDATLAKWLRAQHIQHTENVSVICLKGQASQFNILDPAIRKKWARILSEADTSFVVLDCLWPILAALDLDENTDAGRFLNAFDELKFEADVDDGIVVHHSGKYGDKPRGDSKMGGWADALWRIEVEDEKDPDSARYFSAKGRDVGEAQQRLDYDHATRTLTLAEGTRREAQIDDTVQAVVNYLGSTARDEDRTGRAIRNALATDHSDALIRQALKEAETQGITTTTPGPKRATIHTLKGVIPPSVMSGIQCDDPTQSVTSSSVSVGPIRAPHTHSPLATQSTDEEAASTHTLITHTLPAAKAGAA